MMCGGGGICVSRNSGQLSDFFGDGMAYVVNSNCPLSGDLVSALGIFGVRGGLGF